ncbi:MAG: spore germination protein [Clostridia bacterium]|nr:spore germination protein [Clostridia bacterium]
MDNSFDNFKNTVTGIFADCEDFVCRECVKDGGRFALMFIKGITSRDFISERLLRPLQHTDIDNFSGDFGSLIESPNLSTPKDVQSAAQSVAIGEVLLIVESRNGFFVTLANAQQTHGRSIDEPSSDVTIRGPKAGFVEDAEINMALLRKYIRTPALKFRRFTVGSVSETKVIMVYVSGRAEENLVNEISKRISELKANVITDSANITMLLEGRRNSVLPTCGSTEKVDKAASKLMAGRVGIIVDGSPFVLTLPFLFIEGLQASDDYLHTPYYATFIRILRLFAFISAIFAPAVLCAVVNYYHDDIPAEFYGIIAESRENIPLSFFWEIAAILLLFELLREVGVRMPRTVGEAVGIVGSIILGNTAVEAGIVSSVGVITVAFSAVCAFITPAYMYVIVLARLIVLALAELLGIYGLILSAVLIFLMLCTKRSFSVPYMSPLLPFNKEGMRDFIFCWPKKTLGRKERL